ncbi:MAG: right-handed parallel beta-helix repeat-containing protein [Planctomycetes bacterium]|nr:right-handed parallel beta-helix repeat-containing protein [Planctomycetota bacterium]
MTPPIRSVLPVLVSSLLTAAAAGQTTLYVKATATPPGDGLTWATAFADLQDALALARSPGSPVQAVWVTAGTYVPHAGDASVSFEFVDGVSVYGGFAGGETSIDQRDLVENVTVLSGDLNGDDEPNWGNRVDNTDTVVVAEDCGATTVVDGVTVYGGHSAAHWGAGMRAQGGALVIRNCLFQSNLSGGGGGMMIWDCNAWVENSTFSGNYCHLGTGGGIRTHGTSAPTLVDCVFEYNTSIGGNTITPEGAGAGVDHRATSALMTVRGCTFHANTARPFWPTGGSLYARGGGLHSFLGTVDVRDCAFTNNFANAGGGFYAWRPATVVNCVFDSNTVDALEGDIVDYGGYGAGASFRGSQGPSFLTNCTVVRNEGEAGAVTGLGSTVLNVENSVLWANTATGEEVSTREAQLDASEDVVRYSCVEGLLEPIPGEDPPNPADFPGSIDTNPVFADLAAGDVRLAPGSPAIDAGDNAAVPVGVTLDLAGNSRFVDDPDTPDSGLGQPPIVDMGAYEVQVVGAACPSDLDGSGDVGFGDILDIIGHWGSCPGCPQDLNGDTQVGFADILVVIGAWGPCP